MIPIAWLDEAEEASLEIACPWLTAPAVFWLVVWAAFGMALANA
jgi:hypothetical protein